MKIVLATHNQGKIREFRKIFSDMGVEAVPISEIAGIPEPEETGHTFEENALQKARYYAGKMILVLLLMLWAIDREFIRQDLPDSMGMTKRIIVNLSRNFGDLPEMIERDIMHVRLHSPGLMAEILR